MFPFKKKPRLDWQRIAEDYADEINDLQKELALLRAVAEQAAEAIRARVRSNDLNKTDLVLWDTLFEAGFNLNPAQVAPGSKPGEP